MNQLCVFQIEQTQEPASVRLTLLGELDLAVASALEVRLKMLRAERAAVRLDLSQLQFIDGRGLRVIVQARRDARNNGDWSLDVDPRLARPVTRLFKLAKTRPL